MIINAPKATVKMMIGGPLVRSAPPKPIQNQSVHLNPQPRRISTTAQLHSALNMSSMPSVRLTLARIGMKKLVPKISTENLAVLPPNSEFEALKSIKKVRMMLIVAGSLVVNSLMPKMEYEIAIAEM